MSVPLPEASDYPTDGTGLDFLLSYILWFHSQHFEPEQIVTDPERMQGNFFSLI